MPFIIRMTPPNAAPEYWPEGFGYTCHAHATRETDAAQFADRATAARIMNGYRHPPAFWDSERKHRENMARKFRSWAFEVVETDAPALA